MQRTEAVSKCGVQLKVMVKGVFCKIIIMHVVFVHWSNRMVPSNSLTIETWTSNIFTLCKALSPSYILLKFGHVLRSSDHNMASNMSLLGQNLAKSTSYLSKLMTPLDSLTLQI